MSTWKPIADHEQPPQTIASEQVRDLDAEWQDVRARLTEPGSPKELLDDFLEKNARAWAIETGRIEGIYNLTRGLTEQLIDQGFVAAQVGHDNATLPAEQLIAHLEDQRMGLDLVFDAVAGRRTLSHGLVCEWHACITRSQETAPGRTPDGQPVNIPLRKGQYKIRPNNPRTSSGEIHEYCPPEHVHSEMERLFDLHQAHLDADVPTEVEAAWLHHRFVQIHPFQDGNGRVARALVAWLYARKHWPPPVINADQRLAYFETLAAADKGDLRRFVQFLAVHTANSLITIIERCRNGAAADARRAEEEVPPGSA